MTGSNSISPAATAWCPDMRQVYLKPGDYLINEADISSVTTILGSCVAVILWHPPTTNYCICHYLLTGDESRQEQGGRYGYWVLNEFRRWFNNSRVPASDIDAMVIGGAGNVQVSALAERFQVGACNQRLAHQFVVQAGFHCRAPDVGGESGRKVIFYPPDGQITVQRLN